MDKKLLIWEDEKWGIINSVEIKRILKYLLYKYFKWGKFIYCILKVVWEFIYFKLEKYRF